MTRYTQRWLFLIWFAAVCCQLHGKLVPVVVAEVVPRADYIVRGTLLDVDRTAGWGLVRGYATLKVEEIISGDKSLPDTLPVRWRFVPGSLRISDIGENTGSRIWLFNLENQQVTGSLIQGIWDISTLPEIETALQNPLRMRNDPTPTEPYRIKIGYYNGTQTPMDVPQIRVENGTLIMPDNSSLRCYNWDQGTTHALIARSDKVQFDNSVTTVTLAPGQAFYRFVEVANLYDAKFKFLEISFEIPGLGKSNTVQLSPYNTRADSSYSDSEYLDAMGAEPAPLIYNLKILVTYSPTREIFAGAVLLIIALIYYFMRNRKTVVRTNR